MLDTPLLASLYGKTFLILGSQLGVTWLSTVVLLALFRHLHLARVNWLSGDTDERGRLDLQLDWGTVKPYFWALLGLDMVVFLLLLVYGQSDLSLGLPLFTLWSLLTGMELALALVAVDENLGATVLALTTLITCTAGLIGARAGIDFSFLSRGLFWLLLLLIALMAIRLVFAIPRWIERLWTLLGSVVFTGYLLYDFNRLSQLDEDPAANTWASAMSLSIDIYLDVINLFLQLLDVLSD